jgi:hypothetical protein
MRIRIHNNGKKEMIVELNGNIIVAIFWKLPEKRNMKRKMGGQ